MARLASTSTIVGFMLLALSLIQSGCYVVYWGDADWEWHDECDWEEDDHHPSEGWADNDGAVTEPAQDSIDQAGAEAIDELQRVAADALVRTGKLSNPGPRRKAVMVRRQRTAVTNACSNIDARMRTRFDQHRLDLGGALSIQRMSTMSDPWRFALEQTRDQALADLERMTDQSRVLTARAPIAGSCLLRYTDRSGQFADVAIAKLTLHRDHRVTGELLSGRIAARLDVASGQRSVQALGASRPILGMRWHESDGQIVLVAGSHSVCFDADDSTRRRYTCESLSVAPADLFVGVERRLAASTFLRTPSGKLTLRRTDP